MNKSKSFVRYSHKSGNPEFLKPNLRFFITLGICLSISLSAFAGDINPPSAPDANSMFTIENVYQRLIDGTPGSLHNGFANPLVGPGSTMHSVNQIMEKLPAKDDANGANPEHIMAGKTYWGLTSGKWGKQTGTMVTQTLNAASNNVAAGYYAATTLAAVDADLVSANIKAGVTIFGVNGKTEVVDTTSGDAVAGQILSGKKAWVDGSEISGSMTNVGSQNITPYTTNITITKGYHDGTGKVPGDPDLISGNIRAGANIFGVQGNSNVVDTSSGDAATATVQFGKKAWVDGKEITGFLAGGRYCDPAKTYSPLKRWCDNGDGTVTDTTTGLLWLKNWGYFSRGTYYQRSVSTSNLTIGPSVNPGTWRLPSRQEFKDICLNGVETIGIGSTYFFTNVPTTNSYAMVPYEDADVRFWCCGPVDQVGQYTPDCNTWNLTDQISDYQACASKTFSIAVMGLRHP